MGRSYFYGESLHFKNLSFELPRRYKDHVKIPTFTHEIQTALLSLRAF